MDTLLVENGTNRAGERERDRMVGDRPGTFAAAANAVVVLPEIKFLPAEKLRMEER